MQQLEISRQTRKEYISGGRSSTHGYIRMFLGKIYGNETVLSLQLFENDETFCNLCDEHEACTEAIERLAYSKHDDALRGQFRARRARLEVELHKYVLGRKQNVERCEDARSAVSIMESP